MHKQRTAWSDFFPDSPATNLKSQTYTSSQPYSSTSVYVLNCLFISCTSMSHGGALFCTSTDLLVESSSFFSCTTSNNWGGAIRVSTGQCVLYEVCGYNCYITYTGTGSSAGQFGCIDVNTASFKNYVNYSSIICCVNQISNSYDTVRLGGGQVCCPSVNMSMNKCERNSGIRTYPYTGSSSVTYSFSYSSFVDNNCPGYTCIWFSSSAKYEMKSCNVLRNTQSSSSYGIIYTYGILNIKDSCILENTATNIFYSLSSSYPITLTNCTVDKTTNNGYLTIQNTVTKSFIHGLNHMSTQNCHSEYDSVGTLTAIPYVPTKKSFCFYYTCNHYQGRISAFFSIIWMLLFAFIHPKPFGDC
jgi:hypothetical protein